MSFFIVFFCFFFFFSLILCFSCFFFFFFSSRRRHTRSTRDWSSDVCSSDLLPQPYLQTPEAIALLKYGCGKLTFPLIRDYCHLALFRLKEEGPYEEYLNYRSQERRVGKECRSRWSTYH